MDIETDEEYDAFVSKVVLPNWLLEEFPEPKDTVLLTYQDSQFTVEGETETFSSLVEAYEYAHENLDKQVLFDPSLNGQGGKLVGGLFFGTIEEGAKSGRLLVSHTNNDSLDIIKYAYGVWLDETHLDYEADSEDWVKAYNWLQHHPAFWYRFKNEPTFDWATDDGLKSVWQHVSRNDEGDSVVMLEHGAHVEKDYTHHYHDLRLDVQAATFEEAYVLLAKKVNKFFFADGTERKNVEYEKSAQEKKLDEVLAEFESSEKE